jgi:hypothetical protein
MLIVMIANDIALGKISPACETGDIGRAGVTAEETEAKLLLSVGLQ